MQLKINKVLNKVSVMIESYSLGEEAYSSKVNDLIDELVQLKNNLKKGKNRKFFRKEASRIQNAIQTLRYLKRRSEREIMKKNDKILISESELIKILDRRGSLNVTEATLASNDFGSVISDLVSAKDNFYRVYKELTSSSTNEASSDDVLEVFKNGITESGIEIKNRYMQELEGGTALSPSIQELIVGSNATHYAYCTFKSVLPLIAHIIATYDNKFYDRIEPTGFYGDGTASGLDSIDPTRPMSSGLPYVGIKNRYYNNAKYAIDNKGNIDNIVSNLNKDLNAIITGFNTLFKGISEIPENQTYSNSVYSATNIANDISRLFNSRDVDINTGQIQKIILKDIQQKQDYGYFALSPDKKVQLGEGSVRTLAGAIVAKIKDYYVEELQKSKAYFIDTLFKLDNMIYISSKGSHTFGDMYRVTEKFDRVISELRDITAK